MIRRPPRSTQSRSSAASDVYKRQLNKYDVGELSEAGPAGCDSDKCLLPLAKPEN